MHILHSSNAQEQIAHIPEDILESGVVQEAAVGSQEDHVPELDCPAVVVPQLQRRVHANEQHQLVETELVDER